jgi:hypothetical protein
MKQKRAVGTLFSTLYISGFSLIVITNAGGTSWRPPHGFWLARMPHCEIV